jgi:hypothetical protein
LAFWPEVAGRKKNLQIFLALSSTQKSVWKLTKFPIKDFQIFSHSSLGSKAQNPAQNRNKNRHFNLPPSHLILLPNWQKI